MSKPPLLKHETLNLKIDSISLLMRLFHMLILFYSVSSIHVFQVTSSLYFGGLQLECRTMRMYVQSRRCQEMFSQQCQLLVYLSSLLPQVKSITWIGEGRIHDLLLGTGCSNCVPIRLVWNGLLTLAAQSAVEPTSCWLET